MYDPTNKIFPRNLIGWFFVQWILLKETIKWKNVWIHSRGQALNLMQYSLHKFQSFAFWPKLEKLTINIISFLKKKRLDSLRFKTFFLDSAYEYCETKCAKKLVRTLKNKKNGRMYRSDLFPPSFPGFQWYWAGTALSGYSWQFVPR